MFDELEAYFATQWRVLVNQDGTEVGHPCGHLQFVGYLHYFGLDHDAPEANLKRMAEMCENLGPYDEYICHGLNLGVYMACTPLLKCIIGQILTLVCSISHVLLVTCPCCHRENFVKHVSCNLSAVKSTTPHVALFTLLWR